MNPGKDHPPDSEGSLRNCGGSVGILTYRRAPVFRVKTDEIL
jgi:hypothetical protein